MALADGREVGATAEVIEGTLQDESSGSVRQRIHVETFRASNRRRAPEADLLKVSHQGGATSTIAHLLEKGIPDSR
jgi:hypothetical protein